MTEQHPLETIAMLGYRAYGATTGYKNYQGLDMPEWSQLPPGIKGAWINATDEIIKQVDLRHGKL
jgi:hypothetical protein